MKNLILDSGILGQLCHPSRESHRPVAEWLQSIIERAAYRVFLPEIADYELRRKLLHLIAGRKASPRSLERLDDLGKLLEYLPLDTEMMRDAARLWADARRVGIPTASEQSLDADVILAAQSMAVDGTVVTGNWKHLSRYVEAKDWTQITPAPRRRKGRP